MLFIMSSRIGVLVALIAAMDICAVGQNSCPADLRYVGTLSGSGSYGQNFNGIKEVRLPEHANIDKSYKQQNRLRATNGKGKAKSNLTAKDIPAGIHIIAYGTNDLEKGWAVSEPQLRIVKNNDGDTDYLFGMRLFCSVPGDSRMYGTCSVSVDVCYKPKS